MTAPSKVAVFIESMNQLGMTSLFSGNPIPSQVTVETTLATYFHTINQADFESTAALFAEKGTLYPPFGRPVIGREAIANYLTREAKGMNLNPDLEPLTSEASAEDVKETQTFLVSGHVQTPLFSVNVAWSFVLNASCEIESVQVKLLAGLEELLQLKSSLQ